MILSPEHLLIRNCIFDEAKWFNHQPAMELHHQQQHHSLSCVRVMWRHIIVRGACGLQLSLRRVHRLWCMLIMVKLSRVLRWSPSHPLWVLDCCLIDVTCSTPITSDSPACNVPRAADRQYTCIPPESQFGVIVTLRRLSTGWLHADMQHSGSTPLCSAYYDVTRRWWWTSIRPGATIKVAMYYWSCQLGDDVWCGHPNDQATSNDRHKTQERTTRKITTWRRLGDADKSE